jgi:chromosomal replication initiator protein
MPPPEKPSSILVPFLVLPENRFAFEAVSSIGAVPPRSIYLYGPSGVGKSHLARHAVRLFLSRQSQARIASLTGAEFAAEFADAASRRAIPLFQSATREYDLLVIEDLHVLDRRRETQVQLLALCDELSSTGCQLLWTSRKSPGDMPNFLRKLVARFRGGVTAQIRAPGLAGRVRLLQHFALSQALALPDEAAEILAEGLAVSPRELWAALTQIDSISRQHRRPVDSDLVRRFLSQEIAPPKPRMEEISRAVARQFGITSAQLRSRKQSRGVVVPRQCAMLAARQLTGHSLEQIGSFFGGRDHSTVIHACSRLRGLLGQDPELSLNLSQIEALLGVSEGSVSKNSKDAPFSHPQEGGE